MTLFLVVDSDLFIGIIGCDLHVKLSIEARVRVESQIRYFQLINRVFGKFWLKQKVENTSGGSNNGEYEYEEEDCTTHKFAAAVSLLWWL